MTCYRQNPRTAGRVIEDHAFVVTPGDCKLHMLNRTATELWELAGDGFTVERAAAHLARRFRVDPTTAAADISKCCGDLVRRGILVCSQAQER